jgi:predicted DNA-binding protein
MATSLKLPPKLKARVAAASRRAGKTPHAFMVEAIERQTDAAERRHRLISAALASEKETFESGEVFDAADVHGYLRARAKGEMATPPKRRPWRR